MKKDWVWQQKNAVRDAHQLKNHFTAIAPSFFDRLHKQSRRLKFLITPYVVAQIPNDISEEDLRKNPWFRQFFPLGELYVSGHDAYDGTDNWEKSDEFPTSNIQHKYNNRALVRFRNCFGHCNFCFEAIGTLERNPPPSKHFHWSDWKASLEYITKHPEVEEVILSGGEPLLNSDSRLDKILKDISDIKDANGKPKIRFKRIHTRALTFNPYRITDDLARMFRDYRVNEIAFHVAHPSEITYEFVDAVGRIQEVGKGAPLLALQTPLLKGVNDSTEILWELFSKAYENNIKPYYLFHSIPHIPFADQQRVSVRDGIRLLKPLWRLKSHIALPEYVIVHYEGKQTVPLELRGTPEFQYSHDAKGNPVVKFLNWKDNWVEYPDAKDTIK